MISSAIYTQHSFDARAPLVLSFFELCYRFYLYAKKKKGTKAYLNETFTYLTISTNFRTSHKK